MSNESRRPRVAVIGDVGGHHDELYSQLMALGADPDTLWLPEGLTVVQVGDLIHRGPDSPGVIALVGHILDQQPGQWIQLLGNHEELYVDPEPRFVWGEQLPAESVESLRRWWSDGRMRVAAAIASPGGQWLISHAGLTAALWRELGSPADAFDAAQAINTRSDDPIVRRAGVMLGYGVTPAAGPIWAEAATEVLPPWLSAGSMAFHQAHGHSTAMDWRRRLPRIGPALASVTTFDVDRRHAVTSIGDFVIVGVDPSHGARPAPRWAPLLIDDATAI